MKIKELVEKFGDVEVPKEILKQLGIETKFPQMGDNYYFIGNNGDVKRGGWTNSEEHSTDNNRLTIGNIFKSIEEAEFELEKRKVEVELQRIADENPVDWDDDGTPKWRIDFEHTDDELECLGNYTSQKQGTIYFNTNREAKQAIEKVGENRIKKYLFNMEVE